MFANSSPNLKHFVTNNSYKKDSHRNNRVEEKHTSNSSCKVQYVVEKCQRWCCQHPDLPPIYEDSYAIFGKFVAKELSLVEDLLLRHKLKMKINSILFQANIGKFDGIEETVKRLQEKDSLVPQINHCGKDENISSFGLYVAEELRSVKNSVARQKAKSKISTIICQTDEQSDQNTNNPENVLDFI